MHTPERSLTLYPPPPLQPVRTCARVRAHTYTNMSLHTFMCVCVRVYQCHACTACLTLSLFRAWSILPHLFTDLRGCPLFSLPVPNSRALLVPPRSGHNAWFSGTVEKRGKERRHLIRYDSGEVVVVVVVVMVVIVVVVAMTTVVVSTDTTTTNYYYSYNYNCCKC